MIGNKKKAKVTSKGIQVITIEGQLISSVRCYYLSLGKKNKDVLFWFKLTKSPFILKKEYFVPFTT